MTRAAAPTRAPKDPMTSQGVAKAEAPVLIATDTDPAQREAVAAAEASAAAHMQKHIALAAKGPPPPRPDAVFYGHPVIWRLRDASLLPRTMGEVRQAILAVSCMNAPADVSTYKAELLGWVDAMEAYHAAPASPS